MTVSCRLPDNFSDLPPAAAAQLEKARRAVLDWLATHNYALFIPSLAEYAESLTADDENLQLDIFKMTDTLSGRTLGIRADHTPQIARFDAFTYDNNNGVQRLCYCGPALRTRPPQPWKQREIMQIGAEIFNASTPQADWEIAYLAIGALRVAGMTNIAVELGHIGVLHQLLSDIPELSNSSRATLCCHIARQDAAAVQAVAGTQATNIMALAQISGGIEAIAHARTLLPAATSLLDELEYVAELLIREGADVGINFGEIGGYGYHTGVVFSLHGDNFVAARGGRYDRIGFRPAAGFSMDLREIVEHLPALVANTVVNCPLVADDDSWLAAVSILRQERHLRFVHTDEKTPPPVLEKCNGVWKVRET
jgi:ATP phosphoribosyltransferase regulatory subunit